MNCKRTIALATSILALEFCCSASILFNGDFGTGDLSGWSTFLTAHGNIGGEFGLPDVVSFDLVGNSVPSRAVRFEAGGTWDAYGAPGGGGIFQTFDTSGGLYQISARIAAQNTTPYFNYSAGVFSLFIDGTELDSRDFRVLNGDTEIAPGQIERSFLSVITPLDPGTHELRFQITRSGQIDPGLGTTPFEFLSDVQVLSVPEPSVIGMVICGCIVFGRRFSTLRFRRWD